MRAQKAPKLEIIEGPVIAFIAERGYFPAELIGRSESATPCGYTPPFSLEEGQGDSVLGSSGKASESRRVRSKKALFNTNTVWKGWGEEKEAQCGR